MPDRQLPFCPHLDQLRNQAKDLLRDVRAGEPSALADFREFHPERIGPALAALADAQLVLARSYRASSWPQLTAVVDAITAIARDDFGTLRDVAAGLPALARDRDRPRDGWRAALASAADAAIRRLMLQLRERGAHSADALLARPDLQPVLDTLRLLGRVGGSPAADWVGGSVEVLRGSDFALLAEIGADVRASLGWTALALETYARDPAGKHRILDVMASHGVPLPDSPPMALHRGRLDLLEAHLRRDPALLARTFSHEDIYPPSLACHDAHELALHGAPLAGATLLHMAVDYEDLEVARWLLDHGAEVNARAHVDADGFGGHTALFNCVVTYNAGRADEPLARLLLERGADPNARASLRQALPCSRDKSLHEYRDVTPIGWGGQFHDQGMVSHGALRLIAEHGGHE
ncbi:MAG: ankyrin repeat domain-containing protein [Vicinamibacterales bacterium]